MLTFTSINLILFYKKSAVLMTMLPLCSQNVRFFCHFGSSAAATARDKKHIQILNRLQWDTVILNQLPLKMSEMKWNVMALVSFSALKMVFLFHVAV